LTVEIDSLNGCKSSVDGVTLQLLKYAIRAKVGYAILVNHIGSWRSSLSTNLLYRPHFEHEQLNRVLSCRVYFRRGLHFFIERWENAKSIPYLIVDAPEGPRHYGIRVVSDHEVLGDQEGVFYFVSVKNIGKRTAEEVEASVKIPEVFEGRLGPIVLKGPQPLPFLPFSWPDSVEEFKTNSHRYARAVIYAKEGRGTRMELDPEGFPEVFALFFTVKETNACYIPVKTQGLIELPRKFSIQLMFRIKNMPPQYGMTFNVNAGSWNTITVQAVPIRKGTNPLASLAQPTS